MYFEHVYERGLAQGSYFIGCQETREAIVIDPKRDIDTYLEIARRHKLKITHVTETHIHADFLSGSRELASATGADIYLSDEGGNEWQYQYPHIGLKDGDIIKVGNLEFQVMHTPGHTPEHISFLLTDTKTSGKPVMLFTGDFVFVGDVGRPDLLEKAAGFKGTMETGAKQMFDSLRKFKDLPDYVQVWPGHGAGSACGKTLGSVPGSTVGYEKIVNWALQVKNEEEFVSKLLDGQPEPPRYFSVMKNLNKVGPVVVKKIKSPGKLSVESFKEALNNNFMIIDARSNKDFAAEHISGSINIVNNNSFSNWAGWILKYDEPFVVIAPESRIEDIVKKLFRIGLDNILGYFDSIAVLKENGIKTSSIRLISTEEMKEKMSHSHVIDVRNKSEYEEGYIQGSENIFAGYIQDNIDRIPKDRDIILYCASGERSSLSSSILKANGFDRVYNYLPGIAGWKKSENEVEVPERVFN